MKSFLSLIIVVGVLAQDVDEDCLRAAHRALCHRYHGSAARDCVRWMTPVYLSTDDSFHMRNHPGKSFFIFKQFKELAEYLCGCRVQNVKFTYTKRK